MNKTLCFGGSFNPIHHGHLICARAAAEAAGFDRVVFIPSAQPPHKPANADLASASDRLAMAQLAVAGHDGFTVDGLELNRNGPSYTITTARQLRAAGWSEVHWLIGADMVNQLSTWHEPVALVKEVSFHVLQRPGHPIDWASLPANVQGLRERVITAPLIDISATDIRRRVADGQSIDFLTPEPVVRYIREKRLYSA